MTLSLSFHPLLCQLSNQTTEITSHSTDLVSYLKIFTFTLYADVCPLLLLLLHSTQPPPALVLLCLYAHWRAFISKLITIGGIICNGPCMLFITVLSISFCSDVLPQQVALQRAEPYCRVGLYFHFDLLCDMIVPNGAKLKTWEIMVNNTRWMTNFSL